ncbi:MAG: hypothetical protein D6753_17795 [Planctomycetota bacterium]|nr:MAG: hypothetical protein D6753_17795 [Planctomycetota bacterium]
MTIVLICRDLLFISRIQSAFRKAGAEVLAVPKVDDVRLGGVAADEVVGCLVDLSGIPAGDIPTTIQGLREKFPQVNVLAFCPHVATEKIAAAQQSEAAAVMTRGQFDRALPTIVAHWTQPDAAAE